MFRKKLVLMAVTICLSISSYAQSSTTDTLEKGQSYFEVNFWTTFQKRQNGGMQIYGGRFAHGLSRKAEIGLGFSISDPYDPEYPPELQPNFKYKVYENETHGIKTAVGITAFVPIAKRAGADSFSMVYANVSKNVRKMKDARLTAGTYALIGRNNSFGSKKGWNLMYEQPIHKKIAFSTQWVTGKNRFGYVTPGFNLSLPSHSSLFVGYSIGNYDYDNHGLYVSYSLYRK